MKSPFKSWYICVFWLKRAVFLGEICRSSCDHKETNFECLGPWLHGDPGSSPSVNLYEEPWSDDWMIWGYPHDFGITHWHVLYIYIYIYILCAHSYADQVHHVPWWIKRPANVWKAPHRSKHLSKETFTRWCPITVRWPTILYLS